MHAHVIEAQLLSTTINTHIPKTTNILQPTDQRACIQHLGGVR